MEYGETLWRYFRRPCNPGDFPAATPGVQTGRAGSLEQGELIEIQVRLNGELIEDARFRAYGGPATIAAAAWLAGWLPRRRIAQALVLDDGVIAQALDLPPLAIRSAVLALQAARNALGNGLENPPSNPQ
ncbi:MAG: iron-sulfur cluster assembly scaffold protein [Candidatus Competibacteraceae bacterium]|nr:iron-sulfur cluster assembly scaffold protein [Candidatus Competibacteraceae bacterium]